MKALVTGGGGFLGGALVKHLLTDGWEVNTLQRGDYPFLQEWGANVIRGDLVNKDTVLKAADNCDVVFHVAAKAGVWGDYADYYEANVIATENVISACEQLGILYLVYTSTPSVVFDGSSEIGINERTGYPREYFNAYQATKAIAEQKIIAANSNTLKTVALRPHLIWGPGDRHLVPRVISRARAGKLKLVGNGQNKVDSCYIDNAVRAHVLAADEIMGRGRCAGKVYFISNDEPIAMAELLNKILASAGLPAITKSVPPMLAFTVGVILEKIYALLRIEQEPIMTRFVAKQLSTSHWFDLAAAKTDLNYQPTVTIDEGMRNLKHYLEQKSSS
ncbi:MAG: NAD-dependent epimerase/dehydratase family protein [Gammaproteobacteria bacterium]